MEKRQVSRRHQLLGKDFYKRRIDEFAAERQKLLKTFLNVLCGVIWIMSWRASGRCRQIVRFLTNRHNRRCGIWRIGRLRIISCVILPGRTVLSHSLINSKDSRNRGNRNKERCRIPVRGADIVWDGRGGCRTRAAGYGRDGSSATGFGKSGNAEPCRAVRSERLSF